MLTIFSIAAILAVLVITELYLVYSNYRQFKG